jgi:hypothetical protein
MVKKLKLKIYCYNKNKKMEQLIFIGIFLTVYGVYHLSLFPSIAGGDSGELLAESCHFGVSHPPGIQHGFDEFKV